MNSLSSKMLLTLLPPNEPVVKLVLDEQTKAELEAQLGEEGLETKVNRELASVETAVQEEMESQNFRVPMFKTLRLLVGTGNALLEYTKGKLRGHRLDKYVVQRSNDGTPYLIILKEMLPEGKAKTLVGELSKTVKNEKGKVPLYTQCEWDFETETWMVDQEIDGKPVGEQKTYKPHNFPFIPLVWQRNDEDNYGRGQVEEYLGDLTSYDSLSKSIQDAASIASKILFLLSRNGTTRMKDLEKAYNGKFTYGEADDISTLGIDKDRDLSVALKKAEDLKIELSKNFMLHTSVQRQAERVTAEEIRYLAQELEEGLGGIYSALLSDLQMPLVNLVMAKMRIKLPKDVKPIVVAGFEALGRTHELRKLETGMGILGQMYPQGEHKAWLNVGETISRVLTACRVDQSGLVKSKEQVAKEAEQERVNQAMTNMAPQIVDAVKEKVGNAGQPTERPAG